MIAFEKLMQARYKLAEQEVAEWQSAAIDAQAEIALLRGVLITIAGYGDEENEWDAVELYRNVRELARDAITPEEENRDHG